MRRFLLVAAALFIAATAQADSFSDVGFGLGTGPSYSAFLVGDDTVTETNVGAFLEYQFPLDWGEFSGEYDDEGGEIWNPNWYMIVGYTVAADEDPTQGIFLTPARRIGASDLFFGFGPQVEIWDESLFGETKFAFGGRVVVEMPGPTEFPLRLTAAALWADGTIVESVESGPSSDTIFRATETKERDEGSIARLEVSLTGVY